MLGGFHTAMYVSCIEESLKQTQVFGINVVDAVLNGTNYVRSMKGYLI